MSGHQPSDNQLDSALEKGLKKLTENQISQAPDFQQTLAAASRKPTPKSAGFWLVAATVLLALGLGVTWSLKNKTEDKYSTFAWPEPQELAALSRWTPATDVLLKGNQGILQTNLGMPPLGQTGLSIYDGNQTIDLVKPQFESQNPEIKEDP